MRIFAPTLLILFSFNAMAIDLAPLWDFSKPELSEQRFRAALPGASADDQLILQTQIAIKQLLFCKFRELILGCCAYAPNQGFMFR